MGKQKVVYIAGAGRSGSTILGNVLGQIEGYTHIGEVYFIWSHGLIHNFLCGCGLPVQACPTWIAVFKDAYGGMDRVDPRAMIRQFKRYFGSRNRPPGLNRSGSSPRTYEQQALVTSLEKLYHAVGSVNRASVVVDSSKNHLQLSALSMMQNVELYVLHLVRDPRGVAYSNQKVRQRIGNRKDEHMSRLTAWESSAKWLSRNLYVQLMARRPGTRYQLLRYEDFIDNPRATLSRLLNWTNETAELSFLHEQSKVDMLVHQHTIFGNPSRFQTGQQITLRLDNAWKSKLSSRDRYLTQLLTLPLFKRFGYTFQR